ncbi:MAG: hypothetical protein ACJ790_15315 [Myxococcaceae bacterium]
MLSFLIASVLAQAATTPAATLPETGATTPTHFRAAIELSVMTFPSGTTGGSNDFFGVALPLIGFDGGEDFGFELGAPLRLRFFDDPPEQKSQDFGHVLRRQDWDEPSDFGQILRELRIGTDASAVRIEAGPLEGVTLGAGHLVSRYSNTLSPDYHPAGARFTLQLPVLRVDVIASDVLAARLFAAEVAGDLGRIFSQNPDLADRFRLALSAAFDGGKAGYATDSIGLMQLDFEAALYKAEALQAHGVVGIGTRIAGPDAGFGAVLGVLLDGKVSESPIGAKLELRKQSRGFRHGMFGADHELARFASVGFSGVPVSAQSLPDSWSVAAEFQVELQPALAGLPAPLTLSAGAERFFWGRTDADASLQLALFEGKATATVRGIVTGFEEQPRYLLQGEGRFRLLPALYLVAYGGTVFFPEPTESPQAPVSRHLVRGVYAGAGAGFDFSR